MSIAIKFSLFSHLSNFRDNSPLHPKNCLRISGRKKNIVYSFFWFSFNGWGSSCARIDTTTKNQRAVKLMKWMQIVNGCVSFSVFLCRHFCRIAFLTPWPEFNLLTQWDALLGVQLDHNGCNTKSDTADTERYYKNQ